MNSTEIISRASRLLKSCPEDLLKLFKAGWSDTEIYNFCLLLKQDAVPRHLLVKIKNSKAKVPMWKFLCGRQPKVTTWNDWQSSRESRWTDDPSNVTCKLCLKNKRFPHAGRVKHG